jgi:methylated-DNA-[protein]-cysteine S-methyltransferase
MAGFVQKIVSSPLGSLRLVATDDALVGLYLPGRPVPSSLEAGYAGAHGVLDRAACELEEYFGGRRKRFSTPLAVSGTEFQRDVWKAVAAIPFGSRCSYARLAGEIGRPRAFRAVGAASGCNPIPIFVPCHRVVGSDGGLTGYGGGMDAKRWLLEHERGTGKSGDYVEKSPQG